MDRKELETYLLAPVIIKLIEHSLNLPAQVSIHLAVY